MMRDVMPSVSYSFVWIECDALCKAHYPWAPSLGRLPNYEPPQKQA